MTGRFEEAKMEVLRSQAAKCHVSQSQSLHLLFIISLDGKIGWPCFDLLHLSLLFGGVGSRFRLRRGADLMGINRRTCIRASSMRCSSFPFSSSSLAMPLASSSSCSSSILLASWFFFWSDCLSYNDSLSMFF